MTPEFPIEPVFEVVAVFVGALSGGLAAVRKRFDVFGVLVLAWATGLGGGVLRDVLIGATPPVGIADWRLIAAACLGGAVMYLFHPGLERARRSIAVLDAGALALFTVAGTIKGAELGAGPVAAVCVGALTGVGGGVLRDLLTGEVPAVLHQRELYAVPALLGAAATSTLWSTGALSLPTGLGAVVLVLGLRIVALRFGLQAPGPWTGMTWGRRGRSGRMDA